MSLCSSNCVYKIHEICILCISKIFLNERSHELYVLNWNFMLFLLFIRCLIFGKFASLSLHPHICKMRKINIRFNRTVVEIMLGNSPGVPGTAANVLIINRKLLSRANPLIHAQSSLSWGTCSFFAWIHFNHVTALIVIQVTLLSTTYEPSNMSFKVNVRKTTVHGFQKIVCSKIGLSCNCIFPKELLKHLVRFYIWGFEPLASTLPTRTHPAQHWRKVTRAHEQSQQELKDLTVGLDSVA